MKVDRLKRDRRNYLGGHDAASIVGVNPYGAGVADTYARIVNGSSIEMNPAMHRGVWLEDGIADWIQEQRGIAQDRDVFIVDDAVPFFGGSLDALEVGDQVGHEIKTTTSRSAHTWGVPGTDDVPKNVWVQCQWYLGLHRAMREIHVWCFVVDGDEMPQHYVVTPNEIAIREIRERAEAFWFDHILARCPPLPGVSAVYADGDAAMQVLFPHATGNVIDAGAELAMLAQQYALFRSAEKLAAEQKKQAGARIKALLGEHEGARWSGGSVSWAERSIGEKTSWEQVAHQIALRTGMHGLVFNGIVREFTFDAKSVRALRVNIKGQ